MERYYYVGDTRKTVEEIEGVAAVNVETDERGQEIIPRRRFGKSATDTVRGATATDEAIAAFEAANWIFVEPSRRTLEALEAGDSVDGAQNTGKPMIRNDGSLVVATDLLSVKLKSEFSEAQSEEILAEQQLEVVNKLNFAPNLYEVRAVNRSDALEASVELHGDDRFEFAEPSFVEYIPQRFSPSDPDYTDQWQWNNTGQGGGTAGADVSAEEAWDHTKGAGIRVAVVDNGFDADHEDLDAGVVGESGFFSSSGGGAATFTQGTTGMPGSNHGTFCAGMVGARHNNGRGGCGAAPESELMLVACLGDQVGTQITLARAIAYAAVPANEVSGANPNLGADIIVCSLGPNGAVWELTSTLSLALAGAATNGRNGRGTAIFWAASNGNNVDVTEDEVVSHPDVIAVVRSTRDDLEDNAARGDTVELIAPGVNVYSTNSGNGYGTSTGTSFAAPCAAGCAALALSANPDLTRNELRQVMRDTADKIGGVAYDVNGHNDDYGFGRVNAFQAVLTAAQRVTLETSTVVFNDVPEGETTARAIVWQCFGLEPITFQIVSGPTGSFSSLLGASITIPAPGINSGAKARLWLTYTGTTAGATASGTVRVRCVQTGEEWDVSLTANTIARPKTAVVMVLDQSGSMDWDAGDGRKRVEVLREAGQIFASVLYPDTGVGIARFDHDAYLGMAVTDAGPEIFGAGRAAFLAAVNGHTPNPLGATSIGDGVELAGTMLDAVTGYDSTAMIVLTDGQQNAPKTIADVAASIDDTTFAVGLGAPEVINPAALTDITNGTGGYVVMTGVLSSDEYFVLSKYYLQILAGVTNVEIVLDPSGYLKPGTVQSIPFELTEADATADVILLCPAPGAMNFVLETPHGDILKAGALPPMVKYVEGPGVAYYRFTLPVVGAAGAAHAGRWHAHLECDEAAFNRYLQLLEETDPKAYEYAAAHGLRFALEVQARSSLKMQAMLHQKENQPGAPMLLTAKLTEYGIPLAGRARVQAELSGPGGFNDVVQLEETGPGSYAAEYNGGEYGLYRFRITAAGKTLRGNRFTREKSLTGSIYIAKPPEDPPPPDQDGQDKHCAKMFAVLVQVIEEDDELRERLEWLLRRRRVSLGQLLECLGEKNLK